MPRKKKPNKKSLAPPLAESTESQAIPPGCEISFHIRKQVSFEKVAGEGAPILPRLESLVSSVRAFPPQEWFDRFGTKLNGTSPLDRINYCSQALLSGALPDAATLEFVAVALDKYISSDGSLSLDESFGLKSKPKAGNPVRQAIRRNRISKYLFSMVDYCRYDPKVSIAKAAEGVLGNNESIPAETLEREYRRRGYDQLARASGK